MAFDAVSTEEMNPSSAIASPLPLFVGCAGKSNEAKEKVGLIEYGSRLF